MEKIVSKTILITGGSGFIGHNLLKILLHKKNSLNREYQIRCITRNRKSLGNLKFDEKDIEIVEGDLSNFDDCKRALEGVDIAYYLVHSMEGSTKNWKEFSDKEKNIAETFSRACDQCDVKRIIYLGGLIQAKDNQKSQHMLSRKVVGEILLKSKTSVTIFRAAVILGSGGSSFEMLRYLVDRLPIMVCPKWVKTKCQPIFIGDVISYLTESIEKEKETTGKEFEIGGADILTYLDMMKVYSNVVGKFNLIITVPILTTRLSSYWVELITPLKAAIARPLVESLEHESVVKDHAIEKIIPLKLKSYQESIESCLKDENKYKKVSIKEMIKERTSFSLNYKILLVSLILLLVIGTTYFTLDSRHDFLSPLWIIVTILWYISIAVSIYFIRYGAKLGALLAGVTAWITLAFWLMDNYYIMGGQSILFSDPNTNETWRNIIGIIISGITIMSSHNIFHKEREEK